VVATTAGRPVFFQTEPDAYRGAVVPVTTLRGPLTEGAEPYRVEGDLVIEGDVGGGVTLQAGGWIWVKGSVYGATLEAGQGIWVEGSVKWGRLTTRAGRRRLLQFQREVQAILADLSRVCMYAERIVAHPRYDELAQSRSFGEIILLLVEQQFGHLHEQILRARQTLTGLSTHPAQDAPDAVLNALEHTLYSGALHSIAEIRQLSDALREAAQRAIDALAAGGEEAPVHAYVLIGSEVDAEGHVTVHGSGAEQSVIRSRGAVQINYLRDSRVKASSAIAVETVAASMPDSPVLEVAAGGRIRVGVAQIPTQVRIGGWCRTLSPQVRNIQIESNEDGTVHVFQPPAKHPSADPFYPLEEAEPGMRR